VYFTAITGLFYCLFYCDITSLLLRYHVSFTTISGLFLLRYHVSFTAITGLFYCLFYNDIRSLLLRYQVSFTTISGLFLHGGSHDQKKWWPCLFYNKKTMTKKKGGIMARPVRHLCAPYKPPAQKIHDQKKKGIMARPVRHSCAPPISPPRTGPWTFASQCRPVLSNVFLK
jgi:hypothetical protein